MGYRLLTIKTKKMANKKFFINGVRVYPNSPDLQNCKSVEDVAKLEIFSHFNAGAKKSSEERLFNLVSKVKENPEYDGDGRDKEEKKEESGGDQAPTEHEGEE